MQESGNNPIDIRAGYAGGGILFAAVSATVFLNLSAPGAVPLSGIIAFLALLISLGIFFTGTIDWRAGSLPVRFPAAVAVALYGLHPSTIAALKGNVNENLVAGLTGIAAGLVICRWNAPRWWYRWACLLPAVPCIVLDRAGIGFAPLLAASVWLDAGENNAEARWRSVVQCWPALLVSVMAGFLHGTDGFHPGASIVAFAAIPGSFFAPFANSANTDWGLVDGLACLAVAGLAIAATRVFRFPVIAFGLLWFTVMACVAPTEPLAAFPGLALAVVSALTMASTPLFEAHPSWLKADS